MAPGGPIWVRDRPESRARRIQDTGGASYPFWSWNGTDIELWVEGEGERFLAREFLGYREASSGRFAAILDWEALLHGE